jgi:hypothetical protein
MKTFLLIYTVAFGFLFAGTSRAESSEICGKAIKVEAQFESEMERIAGTVTVTPVILDSGVKLLTTLPASTAISALGANTNLCFSFYLFTDKKKAKIYQFDYASK